MNKILQLHLALLPLFLIPSGHGLPFTSQARQPRNNEPTSVDQSQFYSSDEYESTTLNHHSVMACTNRHNCEMACSQTKLTKYKSKMSMFDALTESIGEETLTDAHKLGIQFGLKRMCSKCAQIYTNCDDVMFQIAKQQLFSWRSSNNDLASLGKSATNNL